MPSSWGYFETRSLAADSFIAKTQGPYKDSSSVRSWGGPHSEEFVECVATMAQYVFDTFGKYPATIPSVFAMMYLQAHKLDTDFYDTHLSQGGYLKTHANHEENWPKKREKT